MNAQFRNAIADWRNVAHQAKFKPSNSRNDDAAHAWIRQAVQPFSE